MKNLLLQLQLQIESLLVEAGFKKRDVEISSAIPEEVTLSRYRLRRHDGGCGLIGKISIPGDANKVLLQATFLDQEGKRCDYQERQILVSRGDSFIFSLGSQAHTISKALLAIST